MNLIKVSLSFQIVSLFETGLGGWIFSTGVSQERVISRRDVVIKNVQKQENTPKVDQ